MTLLANTTEWLNSNAEVAAAVVFGSASRSSNSNAVKAHDIDLHLVISSERAITATDWESTFPHDGFCLAVHRPASGGVSKITVLFLSGQLDLVLVPKLPLMEVSRRFYNNENASDPSLTAALNEMATCLHSGYFFIKGEEVWAPFYKDVALLPGVRLSNDDLCTLADCFLADALWVAQKATSGEIIAAQNALHCKLSSCCLRLYREFKLRRGERLLSFGLGRHVESMESPEILPSLTINANAEDFAIKRECQKTLNTVSVLMTSMGIKWVPSLSAAKLLANSGIYLNPTAR